MKRFIYLVHRSVYAAFIGNAGKSSKDPKELDSNC